MEMAEIQVLPLLISLVGSAVIALLVQRARKPSLQIDVGEYSDHQDGALRFVHLKVRNRPLPVPFNWFMNREVASKCRSRLRLKSKSTGQRLGEFEETKWASTPEPLKYFLQNQKLVATLDPTKIPACGRIDVGSSWELLDVGVKFREDGEFYVSTAYNYPLGVKPAKLRISDSECVLEAQIVHDNGQSRIFRFLIRNMGTDIVSFELSRYDA